jgi:hypothetical protein
MNYRSVDIYELERVRKCKILMKFVNNIYPMQNKSIYFIIKYIDMYKNMVYNNFVRYM